LESDRLVSDVAVIRPPSNYSDADALVGR